MAADPTLRTERSTMQSSPGRLPGRAAVQVVLLATTLVVALLTGAGPAQSSSIGVKDYSPVAFDLDPQTCRDLGRAWSSSQGRAGCSRTSCLERRARPAGDYNTESCRIGRYAYGTELDSETCMQLHRRWVPQVNRCLTRVDRRSALTASAPQCVAPRTTYVVVPGRYPDLCITPAEAASVTREADRRRTSVAAAAGGRSRTICAAAPRYDFEAGRCRPLGRGETKTRTPVRTLVVGDSVTQRAADEITASNPGWVVDGQSATVIGTFAQRYRAFTRLHRTPRTVVLALATNVDGEAPRRVFERAAARVPRSTRLVLVTPFRDRRVYPREARALAERTRWLEALDRSRPGTCVAPWRAVAQRNPDLVVDGVHQTARGEEVFASVVARAVEACR